jgi:thiosulfate reductase cytochrome b subunit
MRTQKHFLIAFISVVFFIGTVGLVTLSDSQAFIKF